MKRSFVPATVFVLALVLAAVAMNYYMKYEYQSALDQLLSPEATYTIVDETSGRSYPVKDVESQVALAGFLRGALTLDKSVNGDPAPFPPDSQRYAVQAAGGGSLMVSGEDPAVCYIKGRIFTHYFTGGASVADYLEDLTESLSAA